MQPASQSCQLHLTLSICTSSYAYIEAGQNFLVSLILLHTFFQLSLVKNIVTSDVLLAAFRCISPNQMRP